MRATNYYLFTLAMIINHHYLNEFWEYTNDTLDLIEKREGNLWISDTLASIAHDIMEKDLDYKNMDEEKIYDICREELNEYLSCKERA